MAQDPNVVKLQAQAKQVETQLKQPSKLNWLAVAGIALAANIVGVIFHF